jgi:hypothetical protein
MLTVVVIGLFLLLGLAAVAGFVDSRAQHSAWHRIAARRRELTEIRNALDGQQLHLQVREEELDALERRLRVREQAVAAAEQALTERTRALDRGAARGPDAA